MIKEERIYRLLFEHSTQGILLLQSEKFILVNQSFAEMVGYTIDELLAFSMEEAFDLIHPQDREKALAMYHDFLAGKDLPKNHEYRFIRRNGETGWWSVTVTTIDYAGKPTVMGVYIDITEHKKAEEALDRRNNLLSAILDVLPVGVCLTDEEGYYRMMNDAYCAIYEYDLEEMLDQHYSVIMPPDQIELANAHYARLLSGDVGIPVERKRQRKDGSIVYIEAANALVQGEDGQKMVITTIRNITERKRTEQTLRESKKLLQKVAENYPNAYLSIIERDLTIGFTAGQEFAKQGLDPEQFIGLSLEQVFGDKAAIVREHYEKTFEGEEHTFELFINNQHQLYRTVPLYDEDGSISRILSVVENITERKQAEDALRESEERLALVLEGSQLGYWDWNIETGKVQRNARWAEMLGYTLQEIEFSVKQWTDLQHPDDRATAWQSIQDHLEGRTPEHRIEYRMRTKDGRYKWILDQAMVVKRDSQGKPLRMSGTHTDINERKRGEEIIQLRLKLMDYATNHPLKELMQKALDEIGVLTSSPIGFYHFVNENQQTLSLQAWSTRTLAEFCRAEGDGMHYPIENAGVWADCVHQRKPVIHNDYAALPHRKGLPEGHAELVRELVVPTMRDGQVVAILGIGNKPSDYDEQDVELVSYIADLVWSIVEQKRTDEQILELNSQLERLAMLDDLTGLMNRRAFFIQGAKEVSRAMRHKTPLSLLMLDVDSFKAVNDRYGHEAGDRVLQHVAQKLVEKVREIDMVARMGGEEFSMLLPNTEKRDALNLAERIRVAVERESCQIQNQIINVTLSIGVASYSEGISKLETILRQADDSMYQAKNQGRNRVVAQDQRK